MAPFFRGFNTNPLPMNPYRSALNWGCVVFVLFACWSEASAQEHQYHFHYHPVNPDTSIHYLYDWFEIEPDGLVRREVGMFKKEMHDLYGAMKPENHPDGTAINLRVFSLEGILLLVRMDGTPICNSLASNG